MRESDLTFLTQAGPEVGVASTKAFTTQLIALALLVTSMGKVKGTINEDRERLIVGGLRKCPDLIQNVLSHEDEIKKIAEQFSDKQHALFLGRGAMYIPCRPGRGIAVDPWFIVSKTPEQAQLIKMARKVNDAKPNWVINKVKIEIVDFLQANSGRTAKEITIAWNGVAFKADTDDLRESPALRITENIAAMHSGKIFGVESNILTLSKNTTNVELVNYETAIQEADIHVVLVDHQKIKLLDSHRL